MGRRKKRTELSASTAQQASALQETVTTLDEVKAMVAKNAENAKRSQIEDINLSNAEIIAQIEQSNHEISKIVQLVGEIGDKTKIINDIVFQTKLLSFNASVELFG